MIDETYLKIKGKKADFYREDDFKGIPVINLYQNIAIKTPKRSFLRTHYKARIHG